jgi:hypothetical protein
MRRRVEIACHNQRLTVGLAQTILNWGVGNQLGNVLASGCFFPIISKNNTLKMQ